MAVIHAAVSVGAASSRRKTWRSAVIAATALIAWISAIAISTVAAETPSADLPNPFQASTGAAARQDALQSVPFDKMDADARTKVHTVLSNVSVFRRLPVRVVDCDPDFYVFLVRHPDVVVNIWEVLKISQLQLRQVGARTYRIVEQEGTSATIELLYCGRDTHIAYVEGTYIGPVFARPINGRALMILKTGYVREGNGRFFLTNRLDVFVNVDPGGVELLTKAVQPVLGKIADTNFIQTLAFVGSLNKTAEVNSRGVQRLAGRLTHVQAKYRQEFADLASEVAERSAARTARLAAEPPQVAAREESDTPR